MMTQDAFADETALLVAADAARVVRVRQQAHAAQFEHADVHNREVLRFLTGDETLRPLSYEEA